MTASPAPSRWRHRAAALAAIAVFLWLVARFWHPVYGFTAFFQLDAPNDDLKIAAFRALPVFVHRDTGGYDGLYYAQLAHDPTLRDPELPRAMDNFAYRARRILPAAVAWLLGLGRGAWIIHTYSLLNVAAWLALAGVLWRLLDVRDGRAWLAWAGVLFSAGALSCVRLALTDLVALAILAAAFLAAGLARPRRAAGLLAAAGLARETSLLALTGLWERPWFGRHNLLRAVAVAAPLAAWLAYVRWRVGPADAGWANFTLPVAGLAEKWGAAIDAVRTVDDRPLAWTTLLATAGLTAQAAFFLIRWHPGDRWWRLGIAYAVMMFCLGTAVWEGFPGAATRVLLPLNLAFNVFVVRTRAPLAWLLAGNLTVGAGLLALRDIPADPRELAAVRSGDVAAILQLGDGWHGVERRRGQRWAWCSGRGQLSFATWSGQPRSFRLDFALRSLTPRTVVLRQAGHELWRAGVGTSTTRHSVIVPLTAGRTTVEFASDTPPVRESAVPGARDLAFALYMPRLTVPEP
ncbi:MAG: hypothetical protein HY736_22960 [Verrucomicrobia bacterium]|nr:hypothetical protein [Verrucomicrobiota bacterium]